MTQVRNWLWPNVKSRKDALFAIDEAFWVSLVVAALTLAFTGVDAGRSGISGTDISGFIGAALLAGVAFGIRRKSRAAAVVAFLLYVCSQASLWITTGHGNLVVGALVALALLHGVRGTFAYAKLTPLPQGTPSIDQSFRAVGANRTVEQKPQGK